jgi:hypothetical protein
MNKKNLYIISYYFTLIVVILYISGIVWVLEFILSIIIYVLIFFFLHILWKKIRKKSPLLFNHFVIYFLHRLSIFIVILVLSLWSFAYYNNEISPAPMPEITISNWEKTVIFQAMSHIWTSDFYNSIVENITKNKTDWYVYFFEWVKPWTEENTKKFNEALWIQFDEELYKNFSKLYWVTNQNNEDFLWLVNNLDFNVDLNLDEIVEQYEKNIEWIEDEKIKNQVPLDVTEQITEILLSLNDKQLKILVYINQSILNFIIKSTGLQETLTNNFTNVQLFDVILNKRNEVLSDEIIKSEYNDIYITYWLLHFKWVLELLQKNDDNWQIIWEKYY